MKIAKILLSVAMFAFVGCGGTDDPDSGLPNDSMIETPQNNQTQDIIPPIAQGIGLDYNITGYFFPYNTLNNGYTYKDYLVTSTDSNGYITDQKQIVKHYLESNENGLGDIVITVFENNRVIKRNIITSYNISSYTIDENNNATFQEQYHQLIRKNEDLIRNVNGACVLKEKINNLNLSDIIPRQADPHENIATSNYINVLHFYCGTSQGTKINRYYADAYGEVVEIYEYSDGSVGYSVYNKNTDQNQ